MNAPTPRPASYQPVTIAEGLRTAAACDPDKVAFSEEGRTITFQKHALGDKGKLVMVQDQSGAKISKTGELSQNLSAMLRILSDAVA